MGYEECEHLAAKHSAHHQDVTGAEVLLLFLGELELHLGILEGEGDGTALKHLEDFGAIEQGDIDATAIGTVVVDYLVVGLGNLGLGHEVLEDVPVLDFAHAQDGVPDLVVLLHRADDGGHIVELLLILHLSPFVRSVGKVFVVVLAVVVVGVKEVFKVVKTYDIALFRSCK